MALTRPVRGVLLIAAATVALAAAGAHTLLPLRTAPAAVGAGRPVARPSSVARPLGTANIDGQSFPSPRLGVDEPGLLTALIRAGARIQRVDPAPWAQLFDQADADVVTTDQDQFFVFAPLDPGRGRWACPAQVEGAMIGGGDAPSYEISIGGDRAVVQIGGPDLRFWTFGELIVATPTLRSGEIVAAFAQPMTCPIGQ